MCCGAAVNARVARVIYGVLAMGWRGTGPGLDGDRVETLLVPLASASLFRSALDSGGLLVGPVPANALHHQISKVLRTKLPDRAAVLPISIRDRVVNLFYAQGASVDEDALRRLGEGAGAAYVRLIALHKKTG